MRRPPPRRSPARCGASGVAAAGPRFPPWRSAEMASRERLLIVSPVRNEAVHVERVVRSVASQTRAPDCWLVIDDESDDDTLERLRRLDREVPFMRVLARVKPPSADGDRLGAALEA